MATFEPRREEIRPDQMQWDHLRNGLAAASRINNEEDDARSITSRGSAYSAATFYSFSTSNYSSFTAAGEMMGRRAKHFVHPQDLDPDYEYDVEWVQDDEAKSCMVCSVDFTPLLRRKHHCRACGRLVCASCSRSRVFVAGLRGVQKACSDCVHEAEKRRACERICENSDSIIGEEEGDKDNKEQPSEGTGNVKSIQESSLPIYTPSRARIMTTQPQHLMDASMAQEVVAEETTEVAASDLRGMVEEEEGVTASTDHHDAKDEPVIKSEEASPSEEIGISSKEKVKASSSNKRRRRSRKSSSSTVVMPVAFVAALATTTILVLNPKLLKNVVGALRKTVSRNV